MLRSVDVIKRRLEVSSAIGLLLVLLVSTYPSYSAQKDRVSSTTKKRIEIWDALRIAIRELRSRKKMLKEDYRLRAVRTKDSWSFWIVFLPAAPDIDITVWVDDDGRVRYVP